MIEGSRFPHGLPRTSVLLLICVVVAVCCVAFHMRQKWLMARKNLNAWDQPCRIMIGMPTRHGWTLRAGTPSSGV